MPLSIHPIDRNDVPRIVDIMWTSVSASALLRATGDIPNPDGQGDTLDPSVRRERVIARLSHSLETSPTIRFLKAVDDETGEIAAFAIWHVFLGPEGLAEWKAQTRTDEKMYIPAGANVEGYRYSWEKVHKKYRMVFGEDGRDHCHLALLATDPAHERRGAGSMLVNWGCELADQHGIECHLESTKKGYPLYQRKGFVDALGPEESTIVFDVSQFTGRGGGNGDWVNMTAMVRPPQKVQS